jgi:hypothetical protein
MVQQLREHNWHGQIVGPHGSGKSTLVAALLPALKAAGRMILKVGDQRPEVGRQRSEIRTEPTLDAATQVIVDGFEQLSWWARRKMIQDCRRQGAGLLVTTHKDMALPTLFRTEPSLDQTRAVVGRLIPAGDRTIVDDDIARAYAAAKGDIRETLFKLFDVYQERQGSR